MSRSSSFLATSSVAEHRPLRLAGRTLLREHGAIDIALRARDPGLADFFAEPLVAGAVDAPLGNISWYCAFEHSSQTLAELSERRREAALNRLRDRLQQALSLIGDAELGPTLRAMLVVPSAQAIRFVGTEPVLIDWAVAPAGVDDAPASWQAQFNQVFGPVCGVRWPDEVAAAGPVPAAAVLSAAPMGASASPGGDAPIPAPSAVPPGSASALASTTAATDTGPASGAAPALVCESGVAGAAATAGSAGVAGGAAAQTQGAGTPAGAPPVAPTPWYHSLGVGLLVSALLVVLFGYLLWWLLWAPGGLLARPQVDPTSHHAQILDGLGAERDRLLALNELSCGPELLDAVRQGFVGPLSVPSLADPPGALPTPAVPGIAAPGVAGPDTAAPLGQPATPPLAGEATPPVSPEEGPSAPAPTAGTQGAVSGSSLMELARSLERSVVMVLGSDGSGQSMGTGFFITPNLVVTNHHVIESVDPAQLWITSQFLGAVRPARVVALTRGSNIGEPDFAVLQVQGEAPANVIPLAIVNDAPKLARVITAGFPTYIAQSDPSLHALLRGDPQAAPAMVFTSGEVSVVQAPPRGARIIVHTADMSQGSSGGPLVDLCGRVAGVNTFIGTDSDSGRRGLYSLAGGDLIAFLKASNVAFQQAESACTEGGTATAAVPE